MGLAVVLLNASLILPVSVLAELLMPITAARVQLKVAPGVLLVGT